MNNEMTSEQQETAKILVVDDEPRNVKILQIQLNAPIVLTVALLANLRLNSRQLG